jgi:hypothetical protein
MRRIKAPKKRHEATIWSSGVLPGKISGNDEAMNNANDHEGAKTNLGAIGCNL